MVKERMSSLRYFNSRMDSNTDRMKSNKTRLVLPELSYKIMGALFKVHNELGPTLLEKYYQRAIAKELEKQGLKFNREVPIELAYNGESIGRYFLDFLVEDKVVLEIKAQRSYNPKFFKQVLAYLRSTHLPLAIIANFRRPKLEYKRVINPEFKNSKKLDNDSN